MTYPTASLPAPARPGPIESPARWLPLAETKKPDPDPIVRRLIVLVPGAEIDPIAWAAQIKSLALPRRLAVLLVGRIQDDQEIWDLRRSLTTLAALVAAPDEVDVETQVSTKRTWLEVVAQFAVTGDMVICHREQVTAASWPWQRRSLAEAIRTRMHVPVCTLSGLAYEAETRASGLMARAWSWLSPVLVIAAMGFVQVEIQLHTVGWSTPVLLSITAVAELILLGALSRS